MHSGWLRGFSKDGRSFFRETGLRQRLAREHGHVKDFRRDLFSKLGFLLS